MRSNPEAQIRSPGMRAGRWRVPHDSRTQRRSEGRTGQVPRVRADAGRTPRGPLGPRGANPDGPGGADGAGRLSRRPDPARIRRFWHGHGHVRPPQRGSRTRLFVGADLVDGPRDGPVRDPSVGQRGAEDALAPAAGDGRDHRGVRPDRARLWQRCLGDRDHRHPHRGLLRPERHEGLDVVRADRRRRARLRPAGRAHAARSWSRRPARVSRPRR